MVRIVKYKHKKVSLLPQDNTKEVSKNEWNDGHNELGMSGHGSVTTRTISSGVLTPIHDMHIVAGEGGANDDLVTMGNAESAEFDEVQLFSGSQVITVKNSGNIVTLSGLDLLLSTTVVTRFIRKGTIWYETGSAGSSGTEESFGDGSDGDVIISVNTDLGSSNKKNYKNLTINAGIILSGNSQMVIRVSETLTFVDSSSEISVTGKGGAGGGGGNTAGAGGSGGGDLRVFAKIIIGTGIISSNGVNGVTGTTSSSTAAGANGTLGQVDGKTVTDSNGKGAITTNAAGGGGGALFGDGATGALGGAGAGGIKLSIVFVFTRYAFLIIGAGGGGGSAISPGGFAGGGGAGAGGFVFVFSAREIPAITIRANGGAGGGSTAGAGNGGSAGGGLVSCISYQTVNAILTATGNQVGQTNKHEYF